MKNKLCAFFASFIFLNTFAMQEPRQKFPIARRKSIPIIFKNGEPVIEDYEPAEKQKPEQKQKEESSLIINEADSQEYCPGLEAKWYFISQPETKRKIAQYVLVEQENPPIAQDEVESGNRKSSAICDCKFW